VYVRKIIFLGKLKAVFFYRNDSLLINLNVKPITLDKTGNVRPNAILRAFT